MNPIASIVPAVLVALLAPLVRGAPPLVVRAAPDLGDVDVDPALTEIRVTFDQAMSPGGRSIVGGGDAFPEITAFPHWEGDRTIVIPVVLRPSHQYWLSINNEQFRNFTSAAGDSAVPHVIQFRTGPVRPAHGAQGAGAAGAAPEANRVAVDRLVEALRTRYSYADRLGIDWPAAVEARRAVLERAATPLEFAEIAGTLLARARDKHVWLKAGAQSVSSYVCPMVPNANADLLPRLVPGWRRLSPGVAIGRWPRDGRAPSKRDGVGYLAIDTWDGAQADAIEAAYEALQILHDAPALVIDVRFNGGGSESLAQGVAGCFIDAPVVYARHVVRDAGAPGGFTAVRNRTLDPSVEQPRYRGGVAVLTGPVVMSTGEEFLLMMKQGPDTVLVGATSQGASGNPRPHDLGNGVIVHLSSWKSITPDGAEFEGRGIAPDIAVPAAPADFANADPVLEAALRHLRRE